MEHIRKIRLKLSNAGCGPCIETVWTCNGSDRFCGHEDRREAGGDRQDKEMTMRTYKPEEKEAYLRKEQIIGKSASACG